MTIKKGFTLIEVIVSIAVLGIMSMGFLSFLSNHYSLLNSTKDISGDVFLTQRDIEEEIDLVKDRIRNKDTSLVLKEKTIFGALGGVKVRYTEVKKTHNNRTYHTLVSDVKPELIKPIDLESIGIKLFQSSAEVDYGYATGGFSIEGNFVNKTEHKYDHLLNVVEWYVSREEFCIPMPKIPGFNMGDDILEISYYYPKFPRDYILVSNLSINNFGSHKNTFSKLSEFPGRHVVFTATPAAKSGKIGVQSASMPIFVSGLPYSNNLVGHFDANYIDMYDTNQVGTNREVKGWIDVSDIYGKTAPTQYALPQGGYPKVYKSPMDTGNKWQYINFSGNQKLGIDNQGSSGKQIYVFAVARKLNSSSDGKFLKNGNYDFVIPAEETTSDWFFIKESINSLDDSFIFGGENIDIAEVIIYSNVVPIVDQIMVQEYLRKKYRYPDVIGEIEKIEKIDNIEVEVELGEAHILPEYIPAKLTRGYYKNIAVKWDGTFDTNTPGTYQLTGISLLDSSEIITYTITVTE